MGRTMDLSDRGMRMLLEFEGKHKKLPDGRYKAYRCPANVCTIYAGLTKGIKDGMIISEAEGEKMLRRELVGYEDAVERLVTIDLTQPMFDALVLLVFNIGIGAFEKSTLLKVLNQGKLDQVPAQFMRWNKGGGRVLPGLVRRRQAEAALFMEPVAAVPAKPGAEEEPAMPQKVEVSSVPVIEGAAKSPTVWTSIAGLGSSIGVAWQWLGSVAVDTTTEVGSAKSSLSGLEALWSHIGASSGGVLLAVTIGSLGVVLARHVSRYAQGRG
jgi:GH24 family phage-related lysozyme (muramidase)